MKMGFAHILSFLNHFIQFFIYSFKCKNEIFVELYCLKRLPTPLRLICRVPREQKRRKNFFPKLQMVRYLDYLVHFYLHFISFFVDFDKFKIELTVHVL